MSVERLKTHEPNPKEKQVRAYDWDLDRQKMSLLLSQEGQIPPSEFAQKLASFQREILINLQTDLGERFNAQLFEEHYPLKNGRLMHPRQEVPFLDSIIEGQQHRLGDNNALNHNQKRELAEISSFSAVETYYFQNPESKELLINPSPPGGDYGLNFIDVFDMSEIDGAKSVRLRRFAVSGTVKEHQKIASLLTDNQLTFETNTKTDIVLKETIIRTSKSDSEILNLYSPDKNALNLDEYKYLKAKCLPVHHQYLQALTGGATSEQLEQIYRASLKFADIQMGKDVDSQGYITQKSNINSNEIPYIVISLARQNIREVKTGCGIQGGPVNSLLDLTSSSLFKISPLNSSLDQDEYGTLEIHCDECGATYNRSRGELEAKCRRCGGTKGIVC